MKKLFSFILIFSIAFIATSRADEQETVDHCAGVIRDFRRMPEKTIPREVLRHARGLAIMTVVKAGFIFSGKAGHGVVVARTRHGWSGPSFIGTGGAGWGAQIGVQATDFIFVLNNHDAVRAFSRGGNVTLGADASVAAGPVGRNVEAAITPTAAIYTYSRSKGLFAGVSLEGAVIGTQKDENRHYYHKPVAAIDILQGRVAPPARAARLHAALGY